MTERLVGDPQPAGEVDIRGGNRHPYPPLLIPGMLVGGFTGALLAALLTRGGWARSREPAANYDLDVAWRLAERTEVIR
jgi:hypothetical protein